MTDRRLSWHLDRLAADAYLTRGSDSRWQLTEAGAEFAGVVQVVPDGPFTTGAYDFDQAYAEVRRGLFSDEYLQLDGGHGARLSDDQASEFAERLSALSAEYFDPGRGDRTGTKYGFRWSLTPVDLHPLDQQ